MNMKFKAGDIVRATNDYNPMSVRGNAIQNTSLGAQPIPNKYECVWYDGNKYQKAIFHEDVIIAFKLK